MINYLGKLKTWNRERERERERGREREMEEGGGVASESLALSSVGVCTRN
jgi:hypothetical protein